VEEPTSLALASRSRGPSGFRDDAWKDIPRVGLRDARSGLEPALSTTVQLLEATGVLWARFECDATDIRATMSRYKDKVWTQGAVEIYLQPAQDGPLYEFQLSPIGTSRDLRVADPGEPHQFFDDSWSCGGLTTDAVIHRDARGDVSGWSAMFGIPLRSVHPTDSSLGWAIGAFRLEYQPEEFSALRSHADADPHGTNFLCELRTE